MRKSAIILPIACLCVLWGAPTAHAGDDITIHVGIGDDQVTEGTDPQAIVEIQLSEPAPQGGICIEVTEGDGSDDAQPSDDYQFQTIDFSFDQGDDTAFAHINIVDDDIAEDTETFTVKATQIACQAGITGITPGINAAVIVDTSDTGTVTIYDTDLPPTGSNDGVLVMAGLGAVGIGVVAVGASRVRRRRLPLT
jgi:hypothetical protein